MKNNNDAIIARIKGVAANPATPEDDSDPRNPNAASTPRSEPSEEDVARVMCNHFGAGPADTKMTGGKPYWTAYLDAARAVRALYASPAKAEAMDEQTCAKLIGDWFNLYDFPGGDANALARWLFAGGDTIAATPPMADVREALQLAINHIDHMAAWIALQDAGYSFESLGEDMPGIRAALSRLSAGNAADGAFGETTASEKSR